MISKILKYDYLVIGAGSGGMASARFVSSQFNKKVALIEHRRLGGTCVNVGCVPKKVTYNFASFMDSQKTMETHGLTTPKQTYNWKTLLTNRNKLIKRIIVSFAELLVK